MGASEFLSIKCLASQNEKWIYVIEKKRFINFVYTQQTCPQIAKDAEY